MTKKYLEYVRSLPCSHCHAPSVDAHHIIGIGMGAMGGKASDLHSMPLCRFCHREVHRNPKDWPQIKWLINTQLQAVADGVLVL